MLRDWLADGGTEAIAPRRAGDPPVVGTTRVLDVADLGRGVRLVLFEADGVVSAAPVVTGPDGPSRAAAGDGAFEAIAGLVREGRPAGGVWPRVFRAVPSASGERAIDVDQSNRSVVVGERLVVKLFPRPGHGPQPGEDLPAHLAAVGFGDVPELYGSVRWTVGDDRWLIATVTAFLPGARDGWTWFLELARRAIAADDPGPASDAAERCGELVARFHVALATPSAVLDGAPLERAGVPQVEAWRTRAHALLDDALVVTPGEHGARLAALAPRVRDAIAAFGDVDATPTQRIHGDLHVGQILRWDGGDAVADLDGNPLAPAPERLARQPAARDVASFVRSLDHLARIVQARDGAHPEAADRWSRAVRRRFLDAYRTALDDAGARDLYDERLVRPFEVAQACHEYVYAARFLPRWAMVADLALPALLAELDA